MKNSTSRKSVLDNDKIIYNYGSLTAIRGIRKPAVYDKPHYIQRNTNIDVEARYNTIQIKPSNIEETPTKKKFKKFIRKEGKTEVK